MRRRLLACLGLPLLLLLPCAPRLAAQSAVPGWPNGSLDLKSGWRSQPGDNPAWAQPGFDASAWPAIALTSANDTAGWRWYRLQIQIPASPTPLALLITGGAGTCEVYLNGQRMPGPRLRSASLITYPKTQVVPIPAIAGDAVIALRTWIPPTSMFLANRGSLRVALGTLPAIRDAHRAAVGVRFDKAVAGLAVYLLVFITGVLLLFLFWYQPEHSEYLWLGCYLLMDAAGRLAFGLAIMGFIPFAFLWAIGAGGVYIVSVLQIQFTFSFVGQRVTRAWRVYQALLLAYPAFLLLPAWLGWLSRGTFDAGEVVLILPVAFVLPILLLYWYRRGNHEAGWLILPSLLPIFAVVIIDAGIIGANLNSPRLAGLNHGFLIGPFTIQTYEVADLFFLIAIGIVMFFRFTRVSRDQARSAAELQAAREIQQYLIPENLPPTPGLAIQSAYRPAREVGGDFFQVLPDQRDGSTLIVVGDVAGKGLQAGMLAALIVGAIRTAFKFTSDPARILALLNERLQNRGLVTCLAIRIDADGHTEMANAGHLPPYIDGKELALDGALPLGALPETSFPTSHLRLSEGQTMLFLSDGVVEAQSPTGELFGFARTAAISTQSAQAIAAAAQAHGQEDDITVLTLTFAPAEVLHAQRTAELG